MLDLFSNRVWAIHRGYEKAVACALANLEKNANNLQKNFRYHELSGIACVPVHGMINHRYHSETWGLAGNLHLQDAIATALADNTIHSIVLDIDSGGGEVSGTPEAAEFISEAKQIKPIYAISNTMSASAAYWLGASATKHFATPSSETGSIGVYVLHFDISQNMEDNGVVPTYIHAGQNKVLGNEYEPLSEDAIEYLQSYVNEVNDEFVSHVAKSRKTSVKKVNETFGQGLTFSAKNAAEIGMVDDVITYQDLLGKLAKKNKRSQAQRRRALNLKKRLL